MGSDKSQVSRECLCHVMDSLLPLVSRDIISDLKDDDECIQQVSHGLLCISASSNLSSKPRQVVNMSTEMNFLSVIKRKRVKDGTYGQLFLHRVHFKWAGCL